MRVLALVLNFFLPGVGSIVVGRNGAGVAQLLMFIVGLLLIATVFLTWFGILLILAAWVWGLITAATG